jgi:hypothetical protein
MNYNCLKNHIIRYRYCIIDLGQDWIILSANTSF